MIDKVPIALDQVESIFEIAFVKNGDRVRIDTQKRTLDLLVDEKEMNERKKNFKPIPHKYRRGVLAKYSKLVGSAAKGAVCD